ncbi:MAG: right-handed parallel beta-helix repeat-containing protein [bacterium]
MRIRQGIRYGPALALLTVALFAGGAAARERTIGVPGDYPTIGEAIEAAAYWDEIVVAPGTYSERVILKDGVTLRSEKGPGETTISYDPVTAGQFEAAVILEKCSNSTQLIGFTIDGRTTAKRAVLVKGEGRPVIASCRILAALNGIGSHNDAVPFIVDTRIEACQIAAIFVQVGSADIRGCELASGEKFGLVVESTTKPVVVSDTHIHGNLQAGVRAAGGELTVTGGSISRNGNGMILEYVSPAIERVLVEGNENVGIVINSSTPTVVGCTIRTNKFGVVVAGTGDPKIFRNTFEDNIEYHIGLEGEVVPLIGGSVENANLFLGRTAVVIQTACPTAVNATFNYWGKPCASRDQVKRLPGSKDVVRRPWVTADLRRSFESCEEATAYSQTPVTSGAESESTAGEAPVAEPSVVQSSEPAGADTTSRSN